MKLENDTENMIIAITLKTGIKLDVHAGTESLSIDTPLRMWDVTVHHGRLRLDGHDVQELIDKVVLAETTRENH